MRPLVEPPPSSHCKRCGGQLRLKLIEPANRILELDSEVFVCIACGSEHSCAVRHDNTMPKPRHV